MALNDRQREDCLKTFQYFDKNNNGTIDKKELKSALQKYGNLSHVSIEAVMSEADEDRSGDINFEEFCKYIAPRLKPLPPGDVMRTSFKIYDVNGDGQLGPDEVIKLASDLGLGKIGLSQANDLISMVDEDGDGRINYQEFKRLVIPKPK